MAKSVARTAVAWFRREDWDEIERLCADVEGTFDEWLARAEAGCRAYSAQGFLIEQVLVRPGDIRDHEAATGRKVDAEGRAEIAARIMVKSDDSRTRH